MASLGRILGTPFRLAGRIPQAVIDIFDKDEEPTSEDEMIREFRDRQEEYRYTDPENPRGSRSGASYEDLMARALQSADAAARLQTYQRMSEITSRDPADDLAQYQDFLRFINETEERRRLAMAQLKEDRREGAQPLSGFPAVRAPGGY